MGKIENGGASTVGETNYCQHNEIFFKTWQRKKVVKAKGGAQHLEIRYARFLFSSTLLYLMLVK